MALFSLRNNDPALDQALKETSARYGISVNRLILDTLRASLLGDKKPRRYSDLDDLAGTWSVAEADAFDQAVAPFNSIDAELWADA